MTMISRSKVHIYPRGVSVDLARNALRRIYFEMLEHGIKPEEASNWTREKRWYPWLEIDPALEAIRMEIEGLAKDCELEHIDTQIVLHFPDRYGGQERPHIDRGPSGQRLECIFGVALTDSEPDNGGLRIWKDLGSSTERWDPIYLSPGGLVVMEGDVVHSGGSNETENIRAMLYYRYVRRSA